MLVLASTSPYRRELLERLRIPFVTASPSVDETPRSGEAARDLAVRLAEAKARAVAAGRPDGVVIGSDQVASLDGAAIGKPGTFERAMQQLRSMRGRAVLFHTAVCVLNVATGACDTEEVPTTVRFRPFSDEEAARYLATDRPFDCAGSAKIESLGVALVESVESTDPTALIGLPLIAVVTLLERAGVNVL